MKLIEILDKAIEYKVTEKTKKFFQAEFESNGRTIRFDADQQFEYGEDDDILTGVWEIGFIQPDPKGIGIGRWDVTKGGKEFEVFATIRKIIEQFIKEYDPKAITFSSDKDESHRGKLYYKLFTKLMPPGYKLKKDSKSSKMWDKFELVKEDVTGL